MKTAQKRPFLDGKSTTEQAQRLETAQNLFVVMRARFPVVLSYLHAGLERFRCKDFLIACCLLACLPLLLHAAATAAAAACCCC